MQRRLRPLLGMLLLVTACGGVESGKVGIPDDDIGLSKVEITAVDVPPPVAPNTSDPGDLPPHPAVYAGSPPVIPHGTADFLPITESENMCIDCHQVEQKVAGEPTPIPPTHFVDLRRSPDRSGEEIVGTRYNCVACHVQDRNAPPLVANDFSREE